MDARLSCYGVYGFALSFVHDKGCYVRLSNVPARYKNFLSCAVADAKANALYVPKIKITLSSRQRRTTYILKNKHSPGGYYCKRFRELKEFDPAVPRNINAAMEFFYAQWCKEHLSRDHASPRHVMLAIKFKRPDSISESMPVENTKKRKRTNSAPISPLVISTKRLKLIPPILNCPLCKGKRWWESNRKFRDRYQRMISAGYSENVAFAVKHMSASEPASPKHLLVYVPCLYCNSRGTARFAIKQHEDKIRKCELKKCYWMHLMADPAFSQPFD
jgi:hypothetical protein